ncbi:MAG: hypothetical protein AB7S38_01235 [Vulcanimicrobiota bacterium]
MLVAGMLLALTGLALSRQAASIWSLGQPGPAIKLAALACLSFFAGVGLLGMAGLRRLKQDE